MIVSELRERRRRGFKSKFLANGHNRWTAKGCHWVYSAGPEDMHRGKHRAFGMGCFPKTHEY